MPLTLSPFSLKPQDFAKSRICEETQLEIPKRFAESYESIPPLWLITIGYPQHGKTVYLSALTLMLERVGVLWQDTHHRYLDDFTRESVKQMRMAAITGQSPPPTQEQDFIRPLLMNVEDIPTVGSYCAVMYDVPGEAFLAKKNTYQAIDPLRVANTLWFFVSLKDIEDEKIYTLPDLFNVYSDVMYDQGISLENRNLIVVYTKADLYEFPPDIDDYIFSDPLQSLTYKESFDNLPRDFDVNKYVKRMEMISEKLEQFTKGLNGGAPFISSVKAEGMTIKFCATSALGQNPNEMTGYMVENARRFRVLDPFIWAVWLHKEEEPDISQSFILILDDKPSVVTYRSIFEENLPSEVWNLLSETGTVVTYSLGNKFSIAKKHQAPPDYLGNRKQISLLGPILDQYDSKLVKAVVITSRKIHDLEDFRRGEWQKSLLIVNTIDENFGWGNTFTYRESNDLDALLHHLRQWR